MYGPRPAILVFALLAALAPGAVLAQGEGKRFAIEGILGTFVNHADVKVRV